MYIYYINKSNGPLTSLFPSASSPRPPVFLYSSPGGDANRTNRLKKGLKWFSTSFLLSLYFCLSLASSSSSSFRSGVIVVLGKLHVEWPIARRQSSIELENSRFLMLEHATRSCSRRRRRRNRRRRFRGKDSRDEGKIFRVDGCRKPFPRPPKNLVRRPK